MDEKPKHRWFQIHLSTAVLLMFVAGGMFWLNMQCREVRFGGPGGISGLGIANAYGWPLIAFRSSNEEIVRKLTLEAAGRNICPIWSLKSEYYVLGILANLAVIGVSLAITMQIIERLICRESRKISEAERSPHQWRQRSRRRLRKAVKTEASEQVGG